MGQGPPARGPEGRSAQGAAQGSAQAGPRPGEKSPDAFRTISEAAEELDLPQHVLRFWETRFGQIRPLKRGGGRRYYRPDDIELLRGIRHLLYGRGYTIKGVQKILREKGPRHVQMIGAGEEAALADLPGPETGPDEAAAEPTPAGPAEDDGVRLASADLALLRQALAELAECRRVLAALDADGTDAPDPD